jgi:hypothetical protein
MGLALLSLVFADAPRLRTATAFDGYSDFRVESTSNPLFSSPA